MDQNQNNVILTRMVLKERSMWTPLQKHTDKRLLRNTAFFAAVSLCLGMCAWISGGSQRTETVMSHLSTGFEYDETLGRLQLVSNILPETALVFLNTAVSEPQITVPIQANPTHEWTQQEPWVEYASIGDVSACMSGEIAAVIQNRAGAYTVRIEHEGGYESIYSGLHNVHHSESEAVLTGQIIGTSVGESAFELRKNGISVLPSFSSI